MAHAAMRTMLERLAFPNDAATRMAADDGERLTMEVLGTYTNERCERLCATLWRPGGQINDAAGNPIANPGYS